MTTRVSQTYTRIDPTNHRWSKRRATWWGFAFAGAMLLSTAGAIGAVYAFWRAIQACV